MKHLLLLLTVFALSTFARPQSDQWVQDYASVLSSKDEAAISSYLHGIEQTTSAQIVVVTVPSLKGQSIEQYSLAMAEKLNIGQKERDNGVLLLLALKEKKLRIEVGYGLEGALTDAKSDYIIRNTIVPNLKGGNFGAGLAAGAQAIGGVITKESDISPEELAAFAAKSKNEQQSSGFPFGFFFILIIIGLRVAGSMNGGRRTGNFFFDMLLLSSMSSGGRGSRGGGGGFGGGFSGGGGGFGGGGASGGW